MIVLDASAAIEVLLDTDLGRRVDEQAWGEPSTTTHAPHLLDVEVTQVLRRLVRLRRLSIDFAQTLLGDLQSLDLVRHADGDLLARALELGDNVTAYDGVYIALAEALGASLLTTDAKLAKVPGRRARVVLIG